MNWDTEQFKCPLSFAIASGLLIALKILNLVWLYYILRVAYRITLYNEQKDARSDDENSEAEDEDVSKNARGMIIVGYCAEPGAYSFTGQLLTGIVNKRCNTLIIIINNILYAIC